MPRQQLPNYGTAPVDEDPRAKAERLFATGEILVARQRDVIAGLERDQHPAETAALAHETLLLLEQTLEILRVHLATAAADGKQ